MPERRPVSPDHRILLKLRPNGALGAAGLRANLQPLYESPRAPADLLGLEAAPQWYIAELAEAAPTAWDLAHTQIAAELGISESDILFAEPDLTHSVYQDTNEVAPGAEIIVGENCQADKQDGKNGKAVGPVDGWHLGEEYSQLADARERVEFTKPRTRIGHLDTGYFPDHVTTPKHIARHLERNFVRRDDDPSNATDPDNRRLLLDNSGHGAGTISILAGGVAPGLEGVMGGAPEAEILPLRVADSVVLLRTSALAKALAYAVDQRCDVVTLSMGGLPSRLWAEAVDEAYEGGVCICAAAGNHIGPTPPRVLVYPARYDRVIAVTGVMANGQPYDNLKGKTLEGSFGPKSVMGSALAAYTPNIPWARFGCREIVRFNGEGTSSATPQVAAAAALWIEKNKRVLPRDYQRVEAVRRALFSSAKQDGDHEHFGNGLLRADAALAIKPVLGLPRSKRSSNRFAFVRLITGLGLADPPPREEMFEVELAQRWLVNEELQQIVADPEAVEQLNEADLRRFMEALIEDPGASVALRKHVADRYPLTAGQRVPPTKKNEDVLPKDLPVTTDPPPAPRDPTYRRLRVYAVDPSLSTRLATAGFNEVALDIRWEPLEDQGDGPDRKGPVGEYLEVEDVDPTGARYQGVDLDDSRLLAQDGWEPSEGNPQFHQQMVYAVVMKTIEHFERALGRPVLWRPRINPDKPFDDSGYAQRLLVRPHALRQANAFYSPQDVALLFGYFEAAADDPGEHMPGSRVYSCLSHDIVAHEATHAILDGMHRRFREPTNIDVLAFHEAFADVVALLQHFTMPEILENEIARTRGAISTTESLLGSLAIQFGHAMGKRGALRDAIGRVEDGVWKRFEPDPSDLQKRLSPHSRGAILVAAVFDAFLAIYEARIADLLRISTGGTGVLPTGAIHPDLVQRLAHEAATSARHVLKMCIRALDYVPPVDLTFFEYLRALITADVELMTDDRYSYRVAFVEAFRRRGIYPLEQQTGTVEVPMTLSVDTLVWNGIEGLTKPVQGAYRSVVESLKSYADTCFYIGNREELFHTTRKTRAKLKKQLEAAIAKAPSFAEELGLDPAENFEVHALHRSMHLRADGRHVPQIVIALTQSTTVPADSSTGTPQHVFRGGSTLIVDLTAALTQPERAVKYCIVKRIQNKDRQLRTAAFFRTAMADPLSALLYAPDRKEPFAALHSLAD